MDRDITDLKVVLLLQARMSSTRLPGKTLMTILGRHMLGLQIERLRQAKSITSLVVAIPDGPADDPIADLCQQLEVPVFRGDEEDVLYRYHQAALQEGADVVVRVTGDCPLIDPEIVDQAVNFFLDHYPKYDYVSNVSPRTFPRGMDVEVFTMKALKLSESAATAPAEREHVTLYMASNPKIFHHGKIMRGTNESGKRLTVDTKEDFELVAKIFEGLYPKKPDFKLEDILTYLSEHPELESINANVKQKDVQ